MHQQYLAARNWNDDPVAQYQQKYRYGINTESTATTVTTMAADLTGRENYLFSYINEMDLLKLVSSSGNSFLYSISQEDYNTRVTQNSFDQSIRPFLPGLYMDNTEGFPEGTPANTLFNPDKTAGVDALGMLSGALAQTTYGNLIYNLKNENPAREAAKYYAMDQATPAPGLDSEGLPAFYSNETSLLDGNYRFTRSDLEKMTMMISDVSMIQMGDLLVRSDVAGDPHVGIVVGFLDESKRPGYGEDPAEFMKEVIVLSTRRGFRMANLGTWGNSEGMFNGFTQEPKTYQIRRLLVKKADVTNLTQRSVTDDWEMVDEVVYKLRDFYPVDNAPDIRYVERDDDAYSIKEDNYRYFRYHPSTSISSTVGSLLSSSNPENPQYQLDMKITNTSGWRMATNSYHAGIDISTPTNYTNLQRHIFAPEDGFFYFADHLDEFKEYDEFLHYLKVDENNGLNIAVNNANDGYRYVTFGINGIFISLPDDNNIRRIYIMSHQGNAYNAADDDDPTMSKAVEYLETIFNAQADYRSYERFPYGADNMVQVKKGDWIGAMGNNGKSKGGHIHLEVLEFFAFEVSGTPLGIDEDTGKDHRWQRINPLTIFDSSLYQYDPNMPDPDHTYVIQNQLINRIVEEENVSQTDAQTDSVNFFQNNPWMENE